MNSSLIILTVMLVGIVIIIVLTTLLNCGKQFKCPSCEGVFNIPVMDQKLIGFGWNIPHTGTVQCPNCRKKRSRRDYNKIEQQDKK